MRRVHRSPRVAADRVRRTSRPGPDSCASATGRPVSTRSSAEIEPRTSGPAPAVHVTSSATSRPPARLRRAWNMRSCRRAACLDRAVQPAAPSRVHHRVGQPAPAGVCSATCAATSRTVQPLQSDGLVQSAAESVASSCTRSRRWASTAVQAASRPVAAPRRGSGPGCGDLEEDGRQAALRQSPRCAADHPHGRGAPGRTSAMISANTRATESGTGCTSRSCGATR